ncbi:VPA1267 family protein [Vibrio sp. 10N.247.311.59]|uniref:VPA1267 family protein n=1 Tax=Vibrio sp. 10N.247.311.59 TaxID=3229989 RepID=UPI00354F7931
MSKVTNQERGSQADESLAKFMSWKETQSAVDVAAMSRGARLNRVEVSKRVGIAKSTLNDNPLVKKALIAWEEELRDKKQLAPLKVAPKGFNPEGGENAPKELEEHIPYDQSLKQLKRLSTELESLKKKCLDKDAEIGRLRKHLERYEELSEVLAGTGVLPR